MSKDQLIADNKKLTKKLSERNRVCRKLEIANKLLRCAISMISARRDV